MMELEGGEKEMVVFQVSVGGFENYVTAKMLFNYFEETVGMAWRCLLKTSSTPPDSHPVFDFDISKIQITDDYARVKPHAFVHFVHRDSAKRAMDAAGKGDLVLFGKPLLVCLGPENPHSLNQRRRKTDPIKIENVDVEMGILANSAEFFIGWKGTGVDFLVDSFDGKCKLLFTRDTVFSIKDTAKHALIKCNYKIEFLVREINWVRNYDDPTSIIILLQLASSPSLYYRTADDDIEEPDSFHVLDDDDPWTRTTDFTLSGALGRCNTFRISVQPRYGMRVQKAMKYLEEKRVQKARDYFNRNRISELKFRVVEEPDFGSAMLDDFFCIHYKEGIPFKVLYMVNAALHKCIINQHQLSDQFYDLLRSHPEEVNLAALNHICSYKRPVFDASGRLKLVQEWLLRNPKLLKSPKHFDDVVEVRRLIITPTKAYCLPPTVELSNRVLRQYKNVSEHFLRVTFMDEGMQTLNISALNLYIAPIVKLISSNTYQQQKTDVFRRIKNIVQNGFHLCGRRYLFLCFSSNQLRDRSAWFFAETKGITVADIIGWMGRFTNRNVAKCAARMGQCFSSTYATVEVPQKQVNFQLPDIVRNGYVFSDGVGKMTPDLALEVAEKLQLEENPCAYQIRYAGCKGVIVCWPGVENRYRLSVRPSMNKFDSNHAMLEICSWTRFQPVFLNRQIVTLLSTLNVADEVFWNMQHSMVSKLDDMFVDTDVAFDVLTASCAEQGNTAAIMLSVGFKPEAEPHLRGMLSCVRAAQLWGLREKARIFVPNGRWLMGCLDELAVLEQGQCFIQVSTPSLENCFANHGSRFSKTRNNQVVKGFVVIAKNPCLHPGDVRVLEAVDAPGLSHLVDCLVFPQKGDRPHANEASGSDLDGDLYFVTWEEKLIPPSKTSWMPMDYTAAEEQKLPRSVNQRDIITFFTKSIVNENLGAICNAHVVHADLSEYGALDEKCIDLAERAAMAVDFPKTGVSVTLPSDRKPKIYPDFMGKEKWQSYKSKKILGRLYRQISDIEDKNVNISVSELALNPSNIPYDVDLEILGSQDFVDEAWKYKCSYDDQLSGLLEQYKVKHEEEIVTGQIWSMPKYNSRKRGDLEEKLKHAYSALRKEFRKVFESMESGFDILSEKDKNIKYEQKASAWYQMSYHPDWVRKSLTLQKSLESPESIGCASGGEMFMFSFSWIAADFLARIKIRKRGASDLDPSKPIGKFVRYIADRI